MNIIHMSSKENTSGINSRKRALSLGSSPNEAQNRKDTFSNIANISENSEPSCIEDLTGLFEFPKHRVSRTIDHEEWEQEMNKKLKKYRDEANQALRSWAERMGHQGRKPKDKK